MSYTPTPNTCGTCKHQGPRNYSAPNKYYMCLRIELESPEETPEYRPNAFVDATTSSTTFLVNDQFGCILWEPRE